MICLPRMILALVFIALRAGAQTAAEPETEFLLRLAGEGGPTPEIVAHVGTTAVYPCEGYGIRCRVTREADTITIRIGGLRRPVPCIQTFSEATGTAVLGSLGGGTYLLRVVYRGAADLYRLTIRATGPATRPIIRHFTTIEP